MRIAVGHFLMVTIKYVFQRGDAHYWQRKVPTDLRSRYLSGAPLKINLQASDPKVIAAKVAKLNREHEALWAAMRKDPTLTPQSAKEAGKALLKAHGITAQGAEAEALELFYGHLDSKRESYANRQPDPEESYRYDDPALFLSKAELEAVRLLEGADKFLLSDAVEVYLEEHAKRGKQGFDKLEAYTRRTFGKLVKLLGDKVFAEVTRDDAKAFRDFLAGSLKSESVARNLNVIRAVFQAAIAEKQIHLVNPFHKLSVAGLGEDSESRGTLPAEALAALWALCRSNDDDVRWLIALQSDTGARLAEIAGLGFDDIHLEGTEVPYIDIRPRPWRTVKNDKATIRKVPLVGASLWAAQQVVRAATPGQVFAFPRYVKEGTCNANAASATINKWMKGQGLDYTTHELRHTMRDRLRNSGAPRDIQDVIGGWGKRTDADGYLDDVMKEKTATEVQKDRLEIKASELEKLAAKDKAKTEELKRVRQQLKDVLEKLQVRKDATVHGASLTIPMRALSGGVASGNASASGTLTLSGSAAN